jgi:hypothetical protein
MTSFLFLAVLALTAQDPPAIAPAPPPIYPTPKYRPMARPAPLPLSGGALRAFAENDTAVHFVDQDSVRRDGDRARLHQYTVLDPGAPSGDRVIVQWMTEVQVDCAGRTVQSVRLSAYDEAGDEVLWLPAEPAEPIRPLTVQADLHTEICGRPLSARHPPLGGWREALAFARARLGG